MQLIERQSKQARSLQTHSHKSQCLQLEQWPRRGHKPSQQEMQSCMRSSMISRDRRVLFFAFARQLDEMGQVDEYLHCAVDIVLLTFSHVWLLMCISKSLEKQRKKKGNPTVGRFPLFIICYANFFQASGEEATTALPIECQSLIAQQAWMVKIKHYGDMKLLNRV